MHPTRPVLLQSHTTDLNNFTSAFKNLIIWGTPKIEQKLTPPKNKARFI